jgi:hypothetical protein
MIHVQLGTVTGVESSVISKCKGIIYRVTVNPGSISRETRAVKDGNPDFSKQTLGLPLQGRDPVTLSVSAQLIGVGKSGQFTVGTLEFPLALCPARSSVRDSFTFTGKGHHAADATGTLSIHVASDGAAPFSCARAPLDPAILEEWRSQGSGRHRHRSKRSKSSPTVPPTPFVAAEAGPLNPIESIPVCVLESVEAAFATAPYQALEFFTDLQFLKDGLEYFKVPGIGEYLRA